jgi:hypothetical protein
MQKSATTTDQTEHRAAVAARRITITVHAGGAKPVSVELDECEAAALARLCEKFTHSGAADYLYPHVDPKIRNSQAYHMVHATARLSDALSEADIRGWPWIEVGADAGDV